MSAGLAAILKSTLRVLIVEDDARYRGMLVTMLRDLECEPMPVASAAEATHWLEANAADLILLDLNMPTTDGLTFLAQLRQHDSETLVIILTGVGTLPAAQNAIRHGVTDFLTKPCHLGTVEAALDRVRRTLAQRRASADSAGTPAPTDAMNATVHSATSPLPTAATLADVERNAILSALASNGGNRSAAAASLGISRRTLHYRLAEYRSAGLLNEALDDRSEEAEH